MTSRTYDALEQLAKLITYTYARVFRTRMVYTVDDPFCDGNIRYRIVHTDSSGKDYVCKILPYHHMYIDEKTFKFVGDTTYVLYWRPICGTWRHIQFMYLEDI